MRHARKTAWAALAAVLAAATLSLGLANAEPPSRLVSTLPIDGPKPWTSEPAVDGDVIRFAVVGDNTGLARPGVFDQAMNQINWMRPDMVMSIGDLFEGYTTDQAAIDSDRREVEQSVAKLKVPFVYVPGNHDLGNEVALADWRRTRGATYYAFVYKNALFLVLDTEDPPIPLKESERFRSVVASMRADPVGFEKRMAARLNRTNTEDRTSEAAAIDPTKQSRFSDDQVKFVSGALKRFPDVRWTFVFMHKPAWTLDSGNFPKIEALLNDRPYTAFAGHNHYYLHEVRNGRDYIQMGTTGGIRHQDGPGTMDHIAWVTLDKGAPEIANIKLSGLLDRTGKTGQVETLY